MLLNAVTLSKVSSLRIGGKANYFKVNKIKDIVDAANYAKEKKLKIHVLGEGTNSYFADDLQGYLFLKLNFKKIIRIKENKSFAFLEVESSTNWHKLVLFTLKNNLWGIENLALIPGSVGASPVQNIGAYGVEIKNTLESVRVFDIRDGKFKTLKKDKCKFGYRDSLFKRNKNRFIILSIILKLSKVRNPILSYKPLNILKDKIDTVSQKQIVGLVIKIRKEKLPNHKKIANCGSFFKNPIIGLKDFTNLKNKFPNVVSFREGGKRKISAAWMVENIAEMKGYSTKNFLISPKQALVIINKKNGSYQELNNLVEKIKEKIFKETKIVLEQEVNFIN